MYNKNIFNIKYLLVEIEGDKEFHKYITCEPQTKRIELDGTEDYFILACDGLWETLNKDELCSFVYDQRNETNIAELLASKAKGNGSEDNITVIFVVLKESLSQITKPN